MSDVELVVVPRDLYYHEVAYVRGLEAEIKRLKDALEQIRTIGTTEITERIGDMYADDGYTTYTNVSEEAQIAHTALSGEET